MSIFIIAQICSFSHHHEDLFETHQECASCAYVQQISGAPPSPTITFSLENTTAVFSSEIKIASVIIFRTQHYFSLAPPLS
ncbi:MAG: hypothetical protein PHE89_04770 [Alphaproteobacteria bacterium]|nr:hypothetical protein [Alphaproteobacteria bacterium]